MGSELVGDTAAAAAGGSTDVTDRAARALGVISAAALPLPAGASTEATLAAVLAKIIAAPATEATSAAILAKIIAAPATEASLAALLAKIPSEPGAAGYTELGGTTVTANANAVVTFAAVAAKTNYLTGFRIDGLGATAVLNATLTITGLLGGTQIWRFQVPAGVLVPLANANAIRWEFAGRGWPAAAANTAIVGTLIAFGAGNTAEELSMHGFLKT